MTSTITEQMHAVEAVQLTLGLPAIRNPASAQAGRRNNKIKLDPLRALEPTRKKLTSVEAQRIVSVLEDAKRKIEVMTVLPYVLNNIDKYRPMLGEELSLLLEQHKAEYQSLQELERKLADSAKSADADAAAAAGRATPAAASRPPSGKVPGPQASYSPLAQQQQQLRAPSARSIAAESAHGGGIGEQPSPALESVNAVRQQLAASVKDILRAFAANPSAAKMILDEPTSSRSREANYLINNLNELRDVLMERLLMTPVEENEKLHYLAQVSAQERNNALVIDKLSAELAAANEEKDAEIRKKNDVIRKLQGELHALEKQTEEEIRRMKSDADKQEAADRKNSDGKKQKLTAEINQLRAQLQNLVTEHREEEQNLRRKKWKIETEVENWIQKYDSDMGDRQDEFEEIDAIYTQEKKQLHELEERFKTLETEYKQIMAERTAAREKRLAAERELELTTKAATTIQAFWRSYKVRKALKQKNKKGGGKKGKKGK